MSWHSWLRQGIYPILIMLGFGGISLGLPRQENVVNNCRENNCSQTLKRKSLNQLPVAKIQQIADSITVKVLSKNFLGSGTLLKKAGNSYIVITNAHVLRAAKSPYRIQTPDGQIYQATVIETVKLDGNDLGLLQFRSQDGEYKVANLGDSSTLKVGDKVFVGGFKKNLDGNLSGKRKLVFTTGEVSLLLEKALKGGYQIGYTNDIHKGMSGAALLNIRGEVVGINGLHQPLWDAPDFYEDGTEPSESLQEQITNSSFAVPVTRVVREFPQLNVSKSIPTHLGFKSQANSLITLKGTESLSQSDLPDILHHCC